MFAICNAFFSVKQLLKPPTGHQGKWHILTRGSCWMESITGTDQLIMGGHVGGNLYEWC